MKIKRSVRTVVACLFFCFHMIFSLNAAQRLLPEQLVYQGAFRLPDTEPYEHGWYWGGTAATYYPDGDPGGADDGYPGSIYGAGHNENKDVCEISIPAPVISAARNPEMLNTASLLQDFRDVKGSLFRDAQGNPLFYEMTRLGMAYLPPQGTQQTGKLHMAWGQHLHDEGQDPSHMWCELDLSRPDPRGGWYFNRYTNYVTCDYMFEIPESWTSQYLSGYRLATGRFRDGLWGGMGPALFAYEPWQTDNPPESGVTIYNVRPLLLYGIQETGEQYLTTEECMQMDGFSESDEWVGGAWVTQGSRSAVLLAGTKGTGQCWYGLPDGTVWDHEDPAMQDPYNQRGWWSDAFEGRILFFDTDDFVQVIQGTMQPYHPQPYAFMNIDEVLWHVDSTQQKYHVSSVCYDRERGFFYVFEWLADDDKPLVHVWKIGADTEVRVSENGPYSFILYQNHPNPFNHQTSISLMLPVAASLHLSVMNLRGRTVRLLFSGEKGVGRHGWIWDGRDDNGRLVTTGVYLCQLIIRNGPETEVQRKKMMMLR